MTGTSLAPRLAMLDWKVKTVLQLGLCVALWPGVAQAGSGPRWSTAQLAAFADVVVIGRVVAVSPGRDARVDTIYTYVTIDVLEVLKSDLPDARITIKQLGGETDGVGLSISDQATMVVGEEVLLYLEARPRDGTLYTTALWQGKWSVHQDFGGQQIAVRQPPHGSRGTDERQLVSSARQAAAVAQDRQLDQKDRQVVIETRPAEAPRDALDPAVDRASAQFALLGPFRYLHAPYVDAQAGGQPGLTAAGLPHLLSALNRWNAAGSPFRFLPGHGNGQARCSTQSLNNGRVSVSFMDPCGEMSNSGGTLALGGSYYVTGAGGSFNGRQFHRAVEGFVVNNDSPIALQLLTTPGCFEDIQTHELGHVLGLNHSSDTTALMFGTLDSSACVNGARELRPDDVQGVQFIYGTKGDAPQSPPANVSVVTSAAAVSVSWSASTGQTWLPVSYRLDFRAGHLDNGAIVASLTTVDTTLTVDVPPGVSGAFNVMVTVMNAAGAGPPSPRVDFIIPTGHATCTTPPAAVRGVTGAVTGQYAEVRWNAVAGAASYQLQVGSSSGGDDLLRLTDLGPQSVAGATVPAGFVAWVRVYAVNACGRSQPVDFYLH